MGPVAAPGMRLATRGSGMEIYSQRQRSIGVGGVSGTPSSGTQYVTYYEQSVVEPSGTCDTCPVRCDTIITITTSTTNTIATAQDARSEPTMGEPTARSHIEMMPPVAEARLQSETAHRDERTAGAESSCVPRAVPGPRWNVCGRLNRRSQLLHLLLGVTVLLAQLFVNIRIGKSRHATIQYIHSSSQGQFPVQLFRGNVWPQVDQSTAGGNHSLNCSILVKASLSPLPACG